MKTPSPKSRRPKPLPMELRIYTPQGINLPGPPQVHDQIAMFMYKLYKKQIRTHGDPVTLHHRHLRKDYTSWEDLWKLIADNQLARRRIPFRPKKRSYGYTLPKELLLADWQPREVTNKPLLSRAAKKYKQLTWVDHHLMRQLLRVTIDLPSAQAAIAQHWSTEDRPLVSHTVRRVYDRDVMIQIDSFSGRRYSAIAELPRVLRPYLRVDDEQSVLMEVDISNSAPLFLALDAQKRGYEVRAFLSLCELGRLYEHFVELGFGDREFVKKEVLRVINGFSINDRRWGKQPPLLAEQFKKEFPGFLEFLEDKKHRRSWKSYKKVSKTAMSEERKLVINGVSTQIATEEPNLWFATIHDAYLVREGSDCDFLKNTLLKAFRSRNVFPELKVKRLVAEPLQVLFG